MTHFWAQNSLVNRTPELMNCVVLFSLLLILGGCGFGSVRQVENVPVPAIAKDQQTAFSLAPGSDARSFAGSLLVWKASSSRNDVAEILSATRRYNEAYTGSRKAIADLYASDLNGLRQELDRLGQEINALDAGSGSALKVRAQRLDAAASWFENSKLGLQQKFGASFDSNRADAIFGRYCDAKLWELATQPFLANGLFQLRPSPSPLCEAYYAKRSYFASPACTRFDPTTGNPPVLPGQSAFECIWSALKLTTFVTEGPLVATVHGPVLDALAVNQSFRAIVAGRDSSAVFCGMNTSSVRKFLLLKVLQVDGSPCVIADAPRVTLSLNVPTEPGAAVTLISKLSPATLINLMDQQETLLNQDTTWARYPQSLLLFSAAQPRGGRQLDATELASDGFARKLAIVGRRNLRCGTDAASYSVSDVLVSLPFADATTVAPVGSQGSVFNPSVCAPFPPVSEFPEILAGDAAVDGKRADLEAQRDNVTRILDAVYSRYCDTSNGLPASASRKAEIEARPEQLRIVSERALIATRNLGLRLTAVAGSSQVSVSLSFGPEPIRARGCFAGWSDGRAVTCSEPSVDAGVTEVAMEASFDPETDSIRLSLPLTQALLDQSSLDKQIAEHVGEKMEILFYANTFEGVVPFVSGNVTFLRGDTVTGRGVASYLIEENASYAAANDIAQQCSRLGF